MISRKMDELQVKTKGAESACGGFVRWQPTACRLAKWFATDPRILILDSPTVGVDVGAKAGIYQIVDTLAAAVSPSS